MLFTEPYAGPAPIVQVISSARREVSLNVYYLSSRPILDALRAAHARGVAVRVILDAHPYGMKPWMIQKEVRAVQATGAALHWAPPRFEAAPGRYVFDRQVRMRYQRMRNWHGQFRLERISSQPGVPGCHQEPQHRSGDQCGIRGRLDQSTGPGLDASGAGPISRHVGWTNAGGYSPARYRGDRERGDGQ